MEVHELYNKYGVLAIIPAEGTSAAQYAFENHAGDASWGIWNSDDIIHVTTTTISGEVHKIASRTKLDPKQLSEIIAVCESVYD